MIMLLIACILPLPRVNRFAISYCKLLLAYSKCPSLLRFRRRVAVCESDCALGHVKYYWPRTVLSYAYAIFYVIICEIKSARHRVNEDGRHLSEFPLTCLVMVHLKFLIALALVHYDDSHCHSSARTL